MSDLISRSELLESFRKSYCGHLGMENSDGIITFRSICRIINEQPTAYSVEKVGEKLGEIRAKKTCNKEKCDTKEICRICVVDDAIEIVKQGGVFDDVCEWKSASDGEFIQNPHTKRLCSNEPSMQNVYCNTCGKKIKVVN